MSTCSMSIGGKALLFFQQLYSYKVMSLRRVRAFSLSPARARPLRPVRFVVRAPARLGRRQYGGKVMALSTAKPKMPKQQVEEKHYATYSGNYNVATTFFTYPPVTPVSNAAMPYTNLGASGMPFNNGGPPTHPFAPIGTNGIVYRGLISGIAPGNSGFGQRVGRQLTIKDLEVRLDLCLLTTASAAATTDTVRCILGIDNCPVDTDLSPEEVLYDSGLGVINISSPYNPSNKNRFKILSDQTYALNAVGGLAGATTNRILNTVYRKKMNQVVIYKSNDPDGIVTRNACAVKHGLPFCLLLSSQGIAFVSQLNCRVKYTDV